MISNRGKKIKIVCSLVIFVAICLVPFTNVSAPSVQAVEEPRVAPINPDFLEFWESPPEHFYGYIPPPIDLSHLNEIPVEGAKTLAALPISFDWRVQGKVTSVKNQNPCGTCWVHGTLAAVESKVLIEENTQYDFSEQNLACCTDPAWVYLIGNRCNGGGWSWLAADTLTKKGIRLEECDPYNTSTINIETCDDSCQTIKMITDYRLIANEASTPAAITPIKNAIYNHGPLAMSYHADDDDSHLYPGNIYYWPDCPQPANHLVCIVGWDDSIAWPDGTGSGAWIVKNSWGTGWGGNGYFYLCYGSASMCEVASLDYKDYDPNEKVYYWDEAGEVLDFGNWSDHSGWMASIFTSSQDGSLTHVDFWTTSNNAQYQIYVYRDGDILDGLQNEAASQSGTCEEFGYYSIPLSSPVSLTNGESFIIAVKMTTPGHSYPIPVEYQYAQGGTTIVDPTIQTGKSFYRHGDGESWTDIATEECNACLRGRVTTGAAGEPDITVVPTAFDETLPPNTTQDYILTISNIGDATLTYSISDGDATGLFALAGGETPTPPTGQVRERQGLIELNPSQPISFPTPPTTGVEIAYDDGVADDCCCYTYAGNAFAVRFTPPDYPVDLKTARFFLWPEWPDFDHEQFGIRVFDDDGAGGAPGTLLGGGTTIASAWGWCDVDISPLGISITSGDFYIAYEQLTNYPDCETLGVDWTAPDPRSWDYWLGEWYPAGEWVEFEYDYMIRCVVEVGEANNPPTTPSNPCPANHATSVSADADLSWTGGDPDVGDTVTYDVYFGTGASPALVSNDQPATSYDPGTLNNDTKYYWKIVATDNHAASTSGTVWDFTTGGAAEDCSWLGESPTSGSVIPGNSDSITVTINTTGLAEGNYSAEIVIANNDPDENPTIVPVTLHVTPIANNLPNTLSNPLPPNHAPNVSIPGWLSWTGGDPDVGDTVTYDVYFGTSSPPPLKETIGPYPATQSSITYDPGTLSYNTKYYWKIIATDNHAASTEGPLWDFTTVSPPSDEDNPDVATGLASLGDKLVVAYGYKASEGGWTWYNPSWPSGANTLTTLYLGRGYWIKVSEARTLTYGTRTYSLDAGWNLIGWLGYQEHAGDNPDVATALASIDDCLEVVYGFDDGVWTWYNPGWPSGANTLTTLYVGRGYWIKVSEDCNLVYGTSTCALDAGWNLIAWLGW